jgi:uncharacterized membrane protein
MPKRWPRIFRIISARPRLFLAALLGVVVIALLPASARWGTRLIIGWDLGVGIYLVLALMVFARADVDLIRREAARQDEGRIAILVLTAGAALASLAAIFFELGTAGKEGRDLLHLGLAGLTLALSWAFVHTMFALHYAHEFYDEEGGGGMKFPDDDEPDYWDFLYFSLVIGMTSQVSDVGVTAKPIRRLVAAHGVMSFVFNTSLIALAVNIAASAL